MRTIVVAVAILSACCMHEVSGVFLRATPKQASSACRVRHADLLRTIAPELAHLEKLKINASSLDHLYWPLYLKSSSYHKDESGERPFFQIHHGKLYVHRDSFRSNIDKAKMVQSETSKEFVEGVCETLKRFPDFPSMRMMVNERDHTEILNDLPVFVPWKVKGKTPINFPAMEGIASIREEPSWSKKLSKAFFAGSPSDDGANKNFSMIWGKRSQLQELYDGDPESRKIMEIHVNREHEPHHYYTWDEQAKWKYQLVLDGEAARTSFATALSMHSVVLKPYSPYYEFFEPALSAFKQFVPINLNHHESSQWDLKAAILWARNHDVKAEDIANAGSRFARDHLTEDGQSCYFRELLLQYHELMRFDDTLPIEFASSPDLCAEPSAAESDCCRKHCSVGLMIIFLWVIDVLSNRLSAI